LASRWSRRQRTASQAVLTPTRGVAGSAAQRCGDTTRRQRLRRSTWMLPRMEEAPATAVTAAAAGSSATPSSARYRCAVPASPRTAPRAHM
jgi:hypothetical protein